MSQYQPPQQQWHLPVYQPVPQYQPQKPPPPKRKWLWLMIAIVVVVFAAIGAIALQGQAPSPAPMTQATQQAVQSLQLTQLETTPTTVPTQPTPPITNTGPAILGANISVFIAKYGTPNSDSDPSKDTYNFHLYGNPQQDDLSITTEGPKALAILEHSPTDQGWSISQAITACMAFVPPDAIYKRSVTLLDAQNHPMALQRVYYSLSLAKQFPASDFTDENSNLTTPGTFSLVLTYNNGNTLSALFCSAQIGFMTVD